MYLRRSTCMGGRRRRAAHPLLPLLVVVAACLCRHRVSLSIAGAAGSTLCWQYPWSKLEVGLA